MAVVRHFCGALMPVTAAALAQKASKLAGDRPRHSTPQSACGSAADLANFLADLHFLTSPATLLNVPLAFAIRCASQPNLRRFGTKQV